MKAILFDQHGSADVLYMGTAPEPHPAPDELLVRVHAAALNRADLLQRRGGYEPPPGASPILGLEIAGEVVQAAGKWQIGDRVMAVVTGGGYAELVCVPASLALPIPAPFTYEQAAAIPEGFLTAYLNLFWLGRLKTGEAILVHAGASGVGSAAIQLARTSKAIVFATAGTEEKVDFCRELGAGIAINYTLQNFADSVLQATNGRGVDIILDFIGAPYWNNNLRALATGGRLMLIGYLGGTKGELDLSAVLPKSLSIHGTTLRRMPLDQKAALVSDFSHFALPHFADDTLRPVIDRVFQFHEVSEAHRYMESNANIGKIILRLQ